MVRTVSGRYQSRATRIEKRRRQKSYKTSDLPAWYKRVTAIQDTHDPEDDEMELEVFDEDLSELGEVEEHSHECSERSCGSEHTCHCSMDGDTERSYDGSEASEYYELKECREKRKRELAEYRERAEKERAQELVIERGKEDEVFSAYKAFKKTNRKAKKKGTMILLKPIVGEGFYLFSSGYIDRFYSGEDGDVYPTKRVDFWYRDAKTGAVTDTPTEDSKLGGFVKIHPDQACSFRLPDLPTRARRKTVKVRCDDGKHDVWFKFFGDQDLIMSVSSNTFPAHHDLSSTPTPTMIEFVGFKVDQEKEDVRAAKELAKHEARKRKEKRKRKRVSLRLANRGTSRSEPSESLV